MSKSGGSSGTQTVQNTIPKELAPYISQELGSAQDLYNSGGLAKSYYPGQTVAPFSADSLQAQQLIRNATGNTQGLQDTATGAINNIAGGGMLNSNPYIDQAYNSAARAVGNQFKNITQPGIASQFNAAGRYGSGLYQNAQGQADQALGQSLNDLSNNFYYQNYNDAAGRQLLAATSAPSVAQGNYTAANALSSSGAQQENLSQQNINDLIARYYDNPQLNALSQYSALINQAQPNSYSSSTTTSTAPRTSALAGGLGGAASGAATGAMIGGPYGALIGGGLGALGGIFG